MISSHTRIMRCPQVTREGEGSWKCPRPPPRIYFITIISRHAILLRLNMDAYAQKGNMRYEDTDGGEGARMEMSVLTLRYCMDTSRASRVAAREGSGPFNFGFSTSRTAMDDDCALTKLSSHCATRAEDGAAVAAAAPRLCGGASASRRERKVFLPGAAHWSWSSMRCSAFRRFAMRSRIPRRGERATARSSPTTSSASASPCSSRCSSSRTLSATRILCSRRETATWSDCDGF